MLSTAHCLLVAGSWQILYLSVDLTSVRAPGLDLRFLNDPRTMGLRLRYRF